MKHPYFVRGDIDGFFGLFIDNLLQLMLIYGLCRGVLQFPEDLLTRQILPGAALSILGGNLFYTWQARKLMAQSGRDDVTALPYGINTPSLFAYIFFIMAPIRFETGDSMLAWKAGLFACFASGVIECLGAVCGSWIRRNTPRAALLSALAGIALTFISMGFVFQIFAHPGYALLPMVIILVSYAARTRMPLGIPGGLVAIVLGTLLAWGLRALGYSSFSPDTSPYTFGVYFPTPAVGELLDYLKSPYLWQHMAIIVPMGLFNAIGSLQNLESAEAAGDRFETAPSMLANGLGTFVAAGFGSPFPTTIYIGHPAWKAMGARAGYSALNGVVIALLCSTGGVILVLKIVPLEVTLGILLWIGLVICAQAFQEVPRSHALAVAFGLIPSIAAWLKDVVISTTLRVSGKNLNEVFASLTEAGLHIQGVIALSQGFLLNAMIFSALMVWITERQFLKAASWSAIASLLSFFGVIHAYTLSEKGIVLNHLGWCAAGEFSLMYALSTAFLLTLHFQKPNLSPTLKAD